jgi:hypothetical protein
LIVNSTLFGGLKMLVDYEQNAPHSVIVSMMSNEKHKFHLTGSRFFGTAKENSDWDFFTEHSISVRSYLFDMGFATLTESCRSYNDQETRSVMRFIDSRIQIDVQLVNDVKKKVRVNNAIKHRPDFLRLMNSLSKNDRTAFWDMLLFASGENWFNRSLLDRQFDNSVAKKALKDLVGGV